MFRHIISPLVYPLSVFAHPFFARFNDHSLLWRSYCRIELKDVRIGYVFSSPELKAQVSYADRTLSVRLSVRLFCRPSVCKLLHFNSSRTTGPILTRLDTNHPWEEGILNCSNEGDCPSPRGDNHKRVTIL
jgi:hypothetical protein